MVLSQFSVIKNFKLLLFVGLFVHVFYKINVFKFGFPFVMDLTPGQFFNYVTIWRGSTV